MDHVDRILEQWRVARPDVDASPMAVIGRLGRAAATVDAALAETFDRHGLDSSTFDVLATLRRQGAPFRLTPAELAADAMITSGAVAQRLNRLEAAGLLRRLPHPSDGRGKLVELSDAGRDLVDRVLPAHLETEARLLAPLDDAERATLATLLGRLTP